MKKTSIYYKHVLCKSDKQIKLNSVESHKLVNITTHNLENNIHNLYY